VSATPHRRRDHISCGHLRGFRFLNQFCLPREAGTQGQVRFRRRAALCSVGMALRRHSSARFPYRLLFILDFYFFPPQKLGYSFYSLVLFYFSFMPLSVFTYFRRAYFLLYFLSPFFVLRLHVSSLVFCCVNFLIACVFSVFLPVPVFFIDSSCVCLSSFPRFILFLYIEWCVYRPTSLRSNIYFKELQQTTERSILVPALNCSSTSFPVAGTWSPPLAAVGSLTYQDLSFTTNEAKDQ